MEMNDEAHDDVADLADFEGTYYKIKSYVERLLASREMVSMSLPLKLETPSSLDSTACSDTNHSQRGYSETAINIFAYI